MGSLESDKRFMKELVKAMTDAIKPEEEPEEVEPDMTGSDKYSVPPLSGSAMPTPGVVPGTARTSGVGWGHLPTTGPTKSGGMITKTMTGVSAIGTIPVDDDDDKPEKPKRRIVNLPSRFTEKVLIAFIDEDNPDEESNVVWAANLEPDTIEMTRDEFGTYLNIKLSLEDVYGNQSDPS